MIDLLEIGAAERSSVIGRASPLLKLAVAVAWLLGLALTLDLRPPILLAVVTLLSGVVLGRIPPSRLARRLAPLWVAALGIAVFNTLFGVANADLAALEIARLGPWRITDPALGAGLALGLRVLAIAAVGVVFGLTTDATALVDSLVQQGRVAERFAYGALAAFQAIPRFGEDLTALRQARRIRGLRSGWHPRLLVGLLVMAIRHGDRLALSMDARAFGCGSRTWYRVVRWGGSDLVVLAGGAAGLVLALAITRI